MAPRIDTDGAEPDAGIDRSSFLKRVGVAGGALALGGLLDTQRALGSGFGYDAAKDPFILGETHATTGALASTYKNYYYGSDLALQELNSLKVNGIGGHRIHVVLKDDQGDPSKEPGVFRQFQEEKIGVVIGPNSSATALAAMPISTAAKIVTLCVATHNDLHDPTKYPYSFVIGPSVSIAAQTMVDWAVSKGYKKIAILHSDDAFGQATAAALDARAKVKGATITANVEHPFNETNMAPYVSQLRAGGPQVALVVNAVIATQVAMLNAFQNLGIDVPIVGTTGISQANMRRAANKDAFARTYAVQLKAFTYTDKIPVAARQVAFVKKLQALGGDLGGLTTAGLVYGIYDFIHMLKIASESVKSRNSDKIKAALESMPAYNGMVGTIKFSKTSHDGLTAKELCVASAASGNDAKSMGGFLLKRA